MITKLNLFCATSVEGNLRSRLTAMKWKIIVTPRRR